MKLKYIAAGTSLAAFVTLGVPTVGRASDLLAHEKLAQVGKKPDKKKDEKKKDDKKKGGDKDDDEDEGSCGEGSCGDHKDGGNKKKYNCTSTDRRNWRHRQRPRRCNSRLPVTSRKGCVPSSALQKGRRSLNRARKIQTPTSCI